MGKSGDFLLDVFVHHQRDGIVIAIDDDISGGINFKNAFCNHKPQIFFLLSELVGVIGFNTQDQRVSMV